MNQEEFEKLIISFAQGNSAPNFTDVIDQMLHQEENLYDFVNSLLDLLLITNNEIAVKSSMILLASLLSRSWSQDIFDENWVEETIKKLISFYQNNDFLVHDTSENNDDEAIKNNNDVIDNEKLYLFSQVVRTIAQNIQQYYIFDKFINKSNESADDESNATESLQYLKDLTFQVSSIYSFYFNINLSKIGMHYETVLDILKRALESHEKNFENAIKSIYILAYILDFFPDEKESINDHIEIIISLANNSDTLPFELFLNLWKSICSFLYSSACSNDIDLVTQFHSSVFKICSLDTISSDLKIYPLRSIWSCACDYDRPIIHQIIDLTCEIASDYVTQSNSLPFDFLFIFESCFHTFEHDMIYQHTRQLIISHLNSEKYSDHIVGLCLLRCMVLNLPHEIFHDADFIINEVEKGLKSDDDLMIEVSSIIISSCFAPISSNLIDVDSLIPQFVPLLIHSNPDVRYHATEACETLLSYSRPQISIPGISLIVFDLVTKVPMEDMPRFLKFLSKCIRHDIKLGTELAIHFANFTYSMMTVDPNSREFNRSMIGGSCYVSISLMSMDENTHEILLPRTMEIISNTIQSDDKLYKNFGITMLNKLMKIFPNESSQLFINYSDNIEEILELDDNDDSIDRRKGIINLSSVVSLNGDENHPFIPKIIEIAKSWLNSDHHSLIGCGLEAIKKLQIRPILPKEVVIEFFQCMATIITQTKSYDVACSCANAMAFCVNHCPATSEAHDEIANIGYQVGLSYIKGEMLILQGVSPIGTDLEFNILYSMSMLVCELFSTPCDIMRFFFPFIESIIHRNNNLNTEVMMICLVSAVKNNALIDEEIEKIKQIVLNFFVDEIPKELMCTEVDLITIMLDKGLFSYEELNDERLMTLKNWWDICMNPSEKSKMKTASAAIVLLVWKLAFNFKIRNKMEDMIIDSFKQFPPDVVSFTPEMINLVKKCIESDTDAPETIVLKLTKGLLKLMALSKMNLKNRGVDDQLFNTCKSILSICLSRYEKVQLMVNNFANKSEIRKSIFKEFIN